MGKLALSLFNRTLTISVDHTEVETYCREVYRPFLSSFAAHAAHDAGEITIGCEPPRVRFNGADIPLKAKAYRSPFHTAVYASSAILQRWFLLHRAYSPWYAAGVCIDGKAVLFSAPTGTGKTTLTLELLRRGYSFYGDEFVFVRKHDRLVFPFRRSFLIREGTRNLFADDPHVQRALEEGVFHNGERCRAWHFVHAGDIFGARAAAPPAPLHAAIVLERGERTELRALLPSIFALNVALRVGHEETGLDRLTSMLRLLEGVACYRLVMADIASAADTVAALQGIAA